MQPPEPEMPVPVPTRAGRAIVLPVAEPMTREAAGRASGHARPAPPLAKGGAPVPPRSRRLGGAMPARRGLA
jgi:hypothetical protein